MRVVLLSLTVVFSWLAATGQGNYVAGGNEFVSFGTTSLSTAGSNGWSTERSGTPGYFSIYGAGLYSNATDAANINGYVKYYCTTAGQGFTFPVGTGADIRALTVGGTIASGSVFATAWIAGDPSSITDPTDAALHPVNSKGAGIAAVSTTGQWDWQDISSNATGTTVSVSIPDMSSFAHTSFLRLVGWNGTQWINLSATQGTGAANGNGENNVLTGTMVAGITAIGIGKAEAAHVVTKVFLQGAMSGGSMTTTLRNLNIIPLSQPYSGAPWNYAGVETVASIPANVTDWVLVELRDAVTPSVVYSTRAAFVKNDGSVVDMDGVSPVSFNDTVPSIANPLVAGNYHIVIKHRNHLPVRTPAAQFLSKSSSLYDFTAAQSAAYQDGAITANAAMKDMGGSVYAMWAGNVNANTTVRYSGLANDLTALLSVLGGSQSTILTNVYSNADINMNGVVRYSGLNNDNTFLLSVLGGNQAAIFSQHQ